MLRKLARVLFSDILMVEFTKELLPYYNFKNKFVEKFERGVFSFHHEVTRNLTTTIVK